MSRPRPAIVEAEMTLRMVDQEASTVQARFRYDPSDPYAFHITFHTGPDPQTVAWTFARELVATGLDQPAGIGDVQVWPSPWATRHGDLVTIALCSPHGHARLYVPRLALFRFLRRSYALVPRGQEAHHQDVDLALTRLFDR